MLQQHKWQYLAAIAFTALFMACGSKKGEEAKDGFFAAKAAKAYYEQLVKGKFDAFINGEVRSQRLPQTYKDQLAINLQKFTEARTKDHAKVDSITIVNATFSVKDSTARAYLMLHYADTTQEQIVVPMEKHHGKWLMR